MRRPSLKPCFLILAATALVSDLQAAGHKVLMITKGGLSVVEADGKVSWHTQWNGAHDLHVDQEGFFYAQRKNTREICKIDPKTKQVVWSYDASMSNGNQGKRIEAHAFQPLGDGKMMVAESGSGRIIEIDKDGKLLHAIKLKRDRPNAHSDTRLVRKLKNGNYLVAHEIDGCVREYEGQSGKVVWEYKIPLDTNRKLAGGHGLTAYGSKVFAAIRLENGTTLIGAGNNHTVLEVNAKKEIVWKLDQYELANIALGWVTTVAVLKNGNYLIGNCHAGPDNPQLIEVNPKTKKVVWTLDDYGVIGNNSSNFVLLD